MVNKIGKILFNTHFRVSALEEMPDLTTVSLKKIVLVYAICREMVALVNYGVIGKKTNYKVKKKAARSFHDAGVRMIGNSAGRVKEYLYKVPVDTELDFRKIAHKKS